MDDIPWWASGNTLLFCIKQEKQKEVGRHMKDWLILFACLLFFGPYGLYLFLGYIGWKIWNKKQGVPRPQKPRRRRLTRAEVLGREGESQIATVLKKIPTKRAILRNVYLPHPQDEGAFTEIDILYIDRRGIVIVESKNYDGTVYPNISGKYWTYYNHGQKYTFFNPLWQNNLHQNALLDILPEAYKDCLYPVVVFGNHAEIKKLRPDQRMKFGLCYTRDLARHLAHRFDGKPDVIDDAKKAELMELLNPYLNANEEQKAAHIQYIQKKHPKD